MQKDNRQIIPLVVDFHPDLPHLMSILHHYQCVIDTSPQLKKNIIKPPSRGLPPPPNLKDLLVRAAFGQMKET